MPPQERKTVLDLPLKVVLSEEGTTIFLRQNKKLAKFKLADDAEEYGLQFNSFSASAIQRLLLIDYISKIEISRTEFLSRRQEVMDLSKLILYGLLYRQYDAALFSRILGSDVIKRWNRANPASIIDDKTRFNDAFLQEFLKANAKQVAEIRGAILAPLRESIARNPNLLPDEMNVQLFLSEKFLATLRPVAWFVLVKFKNVEGFEVLLKELRSLLTEYMEKSRIAEYVALMVMELAVNMENANLQREAHLMNKGAEDATALYDSAVRQRVVESLERKGESVYISWKIGGTSSSIGTQGRLQITLYSHDAEFRGIKESVETGKSADLRKKSLMDFYKEIPQGESETELGMYYLSYLNEACEKVSIKFESVVSQIKNSDTTVINLSFNL